MEFFKDFLYAFGYIFAGLTAFCAVIGGIAVVAYLILEISWWFVFAVIPFIAFVGGLIVAYSMQKERKK